MGIRTKLTLPLLLAFLFFMGILHLLWAPGEYQAARQNFIARAQVECNALESDIIRNLLAHDLAALYGSLDNLTTRNHERWAAFTLFDETGQQLYPLLPQKSSITGQYIIPYRHVISMEGEPLATIEIHLNWQQQRLETATRITQLEGYGFLIAFILLTCTWLWQNKLIRTPLASLQQAMERMAKGEDNAPLPAMGNDEIGELARSFETMRMEIITQQNELRQEVAERKKTEQSLTTSQRRLQIIFDSSPAAIFIHNLQGEILDLNQTMLDLFRVEKEEGLLMSIGEDYSSQDNPIEIIEHYWHEVEKGHPQRFEWIARRPHDNSTFISMIELQKIPYGEQDVIYATVTDISESKAMEEQLIRIKKLESVGVLAGGIAHDFNNLLSAIMGNIELAAYRSTSDTRTCTLLQDAQKATTRAAKLTQQLLTFSRGGSPVKEETELQTLIQESADFVLHGSPIACTYSLAEDLWTVVADGGQVGQVIQNIIINAKHAMPGGGTIEITCFNVETNTAHSLPDGPEKHFICIEIADSGIGIPKEIIDTIFDPYFTTKQSGSGLGLAICHSIITKHDGYLTVQSSPGKGSTFSIYLPSQKSMSKARSPQQEVETQGPPLQIMVMDDEEMIRTVAKAQLESMGHGVILAEDGNQAISLYQEQQSSDTPVDLIIMDLTIPGGMGGQEAANQLLKIDPQAKIIVASGYSNDPIMANYKDYGFSLAIAKPFSLKELRQAIAAVL